MKADDRAPVSARRAAGRVGGRGALRVLAVTLILFFALVWLVDRLLENSILAAAAPYAGLSFVCLLLIYTALRRAGVRRQERRYGEALAARKAKMAEFEALGFAPQLKLIGSSRLFAVDPRAGKWCLIEYYNSPGGAGLQDLSAIAGIEKAPNHIHAPYGKAALLFNGKRLEPKARERYSAAEGVLIRLRGAEGRTVFVNCFKTENDADVIMGYLAPFLTQAPGRAEGGAP